MQAWGRVAPFRTMFVLPCSEYVLGQKLCTMHDYMLKTEPVPAMRRRRVVFPHPFGPTTASLSPLVRVALTLENSCVWPS